MNRELIFLRAFAVATVVGMDLCSVVSLSLI